MAKTFKVTVQGENVLARNLLRLERNTTGKLLDDAVEEAATVLEELQVELAPRDEGALRDSITRQRHNATPTRSEWDTGPGLFYGMFQELGTIFHSAQPFMRPSIDGGKGTAERAFVRRLIRGIRRALRG